MASSGSFTVVSNIPAVTAAVRAACMRAMEICGGKAETYAKKLVRVDTGNLRNSITHVVNGGTSPEMILGTSVRYGIYNEFGTGIHAANGNGRKTPWKYRDSNGVWHRTSGMKPKPFIRPALENHISEYRNVFKIELGMIR